MGSRRQRAGDIDNDLDDAKGGPQRLARDEAGHEEEAEAKNGSDDASDDASDDDALSCQPLTTQVRPLATTRSPIKSS